MTFIICEAGINHCGSLDRALKMVEAAADCGADAVKFQSFTATELGYEPELTEFLRGVELSKDDHFKLKLKADKCGIEFMSTPFDTKWCDFLVDEIGVKRIKISSGKVKDNEFLRHVASKDLPVIMSNGMTTDDEFYKSLSPLWKHDLTMLYCVSEYPTPLHKINFLKMFELMDGYGQGGKDIVRNVGFSDHTVGIEASIIAAASGASVIEAHFTLDKTLPGPDHICSKEPDQFKEMVRQIRLVGK